MYFEKLNLRENIYMFTVGQKKRMQQPVSCNICQESRLQSGVDYISANTTMFVVVHF